MDFYKLRSFDRVNTLTSGHLQKASKYNDVAYMHITERKNEFNEFFSQFIHRDWLYAKDATTDEVAEFIKKHGRVIVKPNASEAGQGIYLLDAEGVTLRQLDGIVGKDIIVEECVVQHPDLCLEGSSVNTIRVATMVDTQGNPHILTAALRCGVGDSVVDNFSTGGVGYPINLKLGIIEAYGVQVTHRHVPVYIHPCTNIVMVGRKIPFWKDTLDLVNKAAAMLPQLRYVGWDVAITAEGPLLIEGNPSPGFGLLEGVGNTRGIYGEIMRYAKT